MLLCRKLQIGAHSFRPLWDIKQLFEPCHTGEYEPVILYSLRPMLAQLWSEIKKIRKKKIRSKWGNKIKTFYRSEQLMQDTVAVYIWNCDSDQRVSWMKCVLLRYIEVSSIRMILVGVHGFWFWFGFCFCHFYLRLLIG